MIILIVLELGCGKGEYTVELAKLYPEMNFIGVDIKGARMVQILCQESDRGRTEEERWLSSERTSRLSTASFAADEVQGKLAYLL